MKNVKKWFQNINIDIKLALFLGLFVFGIASYAYSSLSTNFVMHNVSFVSTEAWRRLEFDKLALDVTIYPKDGVDFLQSLSVMNLGSAYYRKGLEKLILWTDERDVGFQGVGVDQRAGEAKWDKSSSTWYWDDMGITIPESGLRLFISAETERDIDDNRTVQLVIPKLTDNNDNGVFDIGDKGAFFYSKNNGPTDAEVANNDILSIRYGDSDNLGPKSVITNLFNGDTITLRDNFTVSGFSRDQGRLDTKWVQISIVSEGSADNWQDVTTDRLDFGRWTYNWSIPGTGNYDLRLKSRDLEENETISDIITIAVADNGGGIVSANKSELSLDKEESLADGKIYANVVIKIKDIEGNPLTNKNVELSYLREDGYVAKNTQTTDETGVLVWGIISEVVGEASLTAIADGVEMNQHPVLLFVSE